MRWTGHCRFFPNHSREGDENEAVHFDAGCGRLRCRERDRNRAGEEGRRQGQGRPDGQEGRQEVGQEELHQEVLQIEGRSQERRALQERRSQEVTRLMIKAKAGAPLPFLLMRSVLALAALAAVPALAQPPVTQLNAGMHLIRAEVVSDPGTRAEGLMYRKSMAQNAGMLFVFDEAAVHCMWMKNTLIPLSVAFIDDRGAIVNIADMEPQTEASHCAAQPVRYALEMNRGWFAARGVKPGSRLGGIPGVK